MTALPNAPRMGARITAWIRARMAEGYTFDEGTCLQQMHLAAGLPYGKDYTPSNGHAPWAIEAFDHSATAVHESDPAKIPAEVYVFFRSRRPGRPGHIAWAPVAGGHILGTDEPKPKHFGDSTCQAIDANWGMDLVGYDRCLNGYRMSEEPAVKPVPPKVNKPLSRGANIDAAIRTGTNQAAALERAAKMNSKAPVRLRQIKAAQKHNAAALAALRAITPH